MNATIKITAQYYENYGFHEGTERWKPKGGADFEIEVNSDLLMYADNSDIRTAIDTALKNYSNELARYTYIEHDVVFGKTEVLDTAEFESQLRALESDRYPEN